MTTTALPITIPHHLRTAIAESVERGAEFLDNANKGWFEIINERKLKLSSGSECVLGQLGEALTAEGRYSNYTFQDFLYGPEDRFEDGCTNPRVAASLIMSDDEARERGFNILDDVNHWLRDFGGEEYERASGAVWGLMDNLWKRQVRLRDAANV